MYDIAPTLPEDVLISESQVQNADHVEHVDAKHRNIMPLCGPEEMRTCKEIEKGFGQETAKDEAARCLQCGLICYERKWEDTPAQEAIAQSA